MDNVTILDQLEKLDKKFYAKAIEVSEAAAIKLSRILETFPHYTSHDQTHKAKVLEICEWLAGPLLLQQLNSAELFVLFSAIYLHDVGMALEPKEKSAIESSPEYRQFAEASGLAPMEALAEWVRRLHHKRSAEIVRRTHADATGVAIRDEALAHATALICESHGESDLEDFEKYDPFFAYGTSGTSVCLPLLGVLLRLSDLLHITTDRTPLAVLPLIRLTSEKSKAEWSKHLSTVGIAPLPDGSVRVTCICNDPDTHRDILRLCDHINKEFEYSKRILAKLQAAEHPKYDLKCSRVVPNITAMGYEPWLDLTFQLDREGIIQLLTGERIYHGPSAVLKELLMNAVDASRQARVLAGAPGHILVDFDSTGSRLSVSDCGIGMDRADLEEFLLRLGRCVYNSEIYNQRYAPQQRIDALSEFGIGFASCFLVSDHVVVETKRNDDDAYLLDLYDMLGFAAARKSAKKEAGTTVTLHLKQGVAKKIEGAVKGLSSTCPHVEIPILVQADGEQIDVQWQPYCLSDDQLLVPFFQSRTTNLVVDHHHFGQEEKDIDGCLYLLCQQKDGVVLPGYSDWFKLSHSDTRRIAQLGFALPGLGNWPDSLLGKFNVSALRYDLNLKGDMRLDMDPSRTTILPSTHNLDVIRRLDEHIVSYLVGLHQRHWSGIAREERFVAHRALGHMFFTRVMDAMTLNTQKPARQLADLMFDNLPLLTASKNQVFRDLTWNEIRHLGTPVVFYQRFTLVPDYEKHVASILDAVPEVLVVIDEPSFPYGANLLAYCTEKQIHVSEVSQRIYEVVEPWQGSADDLQSLRWSTERFNPWAFLVPFIPPTPYALVASTASRRGGGVGVWVNWTHPKIATLRQAAAKAQESGQKMPKCVRFLRFMNEYHGGVSTDPDYVEYVQQNQRQAIEELVATGTIQASNSSLLLLTAEDFVPWERGG